MTTEQCSFIIDVIEKCKAMLDGKEPLHRDEFEAELERCSELVYDHGWERNHYRAMVSALSKANSALDTALHYEMGSADYRTVYDACTATTNILMDISEYRKSNVVANNVINPTT